MLRHRKPLIPRLESAYDELIERVAALTERAGSDALNRRPGEGRWSAAECIDHLNTTARLYIEPFDEAIAEARRSGLTGDRPDGRTLLGRLITWTQEPPPRFTMSTFSELEPGRDIDAGQLAAEFEAVHAALLTQLRGAADLDRKRVKVRSLLDSRLRLSLDDWYAFIAAHARRHLWQAERALEAVGSQPLNP